MQDIIMYLEIEQNDIKEMCYEERWCFSDRVIRLVEGEWFES